MRVQKYYVENKHYLRHENKVNENKVLIIVLWGSKIYVKQWKKKLLSFMSNLQTYDYF